jgi:hypothetical protein
MSLPKGGLLHPLLLEPRYWRERIELASAVPLGTVVLPCPERSTKASTVEEIYLWAQDGLRLKATLLRHPGEPPRLELRPTPAGTPGDPLLAAAEGTADACAALWFSSPSGRRLEDRVMDVLRVIRAARGVCEGLAVSIEPADDSVPDEFAIARELVERGWA